MRNRSSEILRRVIIFCLLTAIRCATASHGRSQEINVDSDPPGAIARLDCDGKTGITSIITPAPISVRRAAQHCIVVITRDGFQDQQVVLQRRYSALYWSNLALLPEFAAEGAYEDAQCTGWLCGGNGGLGAGAVMGAALTGAGFGVDAITGAKYEHTPARIDVVLKPLTVASSVAVEQSPRGTQGP